MLCQNFVAKFQINVHSLWKNAERHFERKSSVLYMVFSSHRVRKQKLKFLRHRWAIKYIYIYILRNYLQLPRTTGFKNLNEYDLQCYKSWRLTKVNYSPVKPGNGPEHTFIPEQGRDSSVLCMHTVWSGTSISTIKLGKVKQTFRQNFLLYTLRRFLPVSAGKNLQCSHKLIRLGSSLCRRC